MTAFPEPQYMTVEEFLEFDRNATDARYEYIDGRVYMQAGGSANDSIISGNIFAFLRNALRDSSCQTFNSDMRVRLTKKRYVLPDVSVSCDPQDRGEAEFLESPRLIVEVLSPSTENLDRGEKFTAYRERPTIQEYVLVNTRYKAVEIFRRQKKNLWMYQVLEIKDELELASIDVRMPVTAIYEDAIIPDQEFSSEDDDPFV